MGFIEDISTATDIIRSADAVTLVSHIDADGITSEAIAAQAISRLGIPVTPVFVRQLEPMTMRHVPNDDTLKVFTDLGAGQQNLMEDAGLPTDRVLILDHHINQPAPGGMQNVLQQALPTWLHANWIRQTPILQNLLWLAMSAT